LKIYHFIRATKNVIIVLKLKKKIMLPDFIACHTRPVTYFYFKICA